MSKYNKSVLTDAGIDLARRANAGKAKFVITRTAASSAELSKKSEAELEKLTDLPDIVQYGKIQDAEGVESDNTILGVSLRYDNQDLKKGYNINAVGIYVKEEGKDKDFLYALTTAEQPEYMPDFSDQVLYRFNLQMYLVVGRAATVNVLVDDDTVVSVGKFEKYKTEIEKELDTKAAKSDTYTKQEVDNKFGGKVSAISVNNGAPVKPDADGTVHISTPDPDLSGYETRAYADIRFNEKADKSDTYTKAETDKQLITYITTNFDGNSYKNEQRPVNKAELVAKSALKGAVDYLKQQEKNDTAFIIRNQQDTDTRISDLDGRVYDVENKQTQMTQNITNLTTKVENGLVHVFNTLAEATAASKQHPDWVCASTEG